jgi:hypothetical protein
MQFGPIRLPRPDTRCPNIFIAAGVVLLWIDYCGVIDSAKSKRVLGL